MKRWLSVVALSAFALGTEALASDAADAAHAKQFKSKVIKAEKTQDDTRVEVADTGVKLAIDPATGRLRKPTAEERAALRRGLEKMLSRSSDNVTVEQRADGTAVATIEEGFENMMLVRRNADGSLEHVCTTSAEQAAEVLLNDGATTSSNLETE